MPENGPAPDTMTDGPHSAIRYRPDIDGLRAVAVCAVIAFHLHFDHTPGGYIGVDVFFVISGYLISAIILKDLHKSRFSISGFYERRTRRILPALFLVILVTTALSYVYLLPSEFKDFANSLIATVFSASNFYFLTQSGYFTGGGGPLLHTWSLAVEEQFYIFFPLLLMYVYRHKREWLKQSVLIVAVLSFALSIFCQFHYPTANFYLPVTRAWELGLGAMISMRFFPALRGRIWREVFAALGAALVLIPIFTYSEATPFPGLAALPPCLGAALLIFAGETGNSLTRSTLSLRPFTFLGKISYSLYLWHWPLVYFSGNGLLTFGALTHRENVAIYLSTCLVLAFLSWKYVELPSRFGQFHVPKRQLFLVTGGVIVAFAALGLSIRALDGLSYRYTPDALAIARWSGEDRGAQYSDFGVGKCFIVAPDSFSHYKPDLCLHQDPAEKNYLLLGDSHAAALAHALREQLHGIHLLQATASSCKPLLGQGPRGLCGEMMTYIYEDYLRDHHVDAILLTARWKERDIPAIASVVTWARARGMAVVVIGPAEEYDTPLPVLLAYAINKGDPGLPDRHGMTQIEALDQRMRMAATNDWRVPYVSLIGALCSPVTCREYADDSKTVPMLFDHDHYTDQGSSFVIGKLIKEGAFSFAGQGGSKVTAQSMLR